MLWASLVTVPDEKALSIPLRISLRPLTPPSLLIMAKYASVPTLAPSNRPAMGAEMSLMEPTVMEFAVTPGVAVAAAPAAAGH